MASPEQHKAWTDRWIYWMRAGLTAEPETYCVMASPLRVAHGLCLSVIPLDRYKRGAMFCSPECHADYHRLRRFWRSLQNCRLCGRKARKVKAVEAVRSEHAEDSGVVQP